MSMRRANVARRSTAIAFAGVLALLSAGLGAASASAANSSSALNRANARLSLAVVGHSNQFCSLARNLAKTNEANIASNSVSSMQASFKQLKSEEGVVLADAPAKIKPQFQDLLNFFNNFYGQLAKVKWQLVKLPPSYLASLQNSEKRLTADSTAITNYLRTACGIKSS